MKKEEIATVNKELFHVIGYMAERLERENKKELLSALKSGTLTLKQAAKVLLEWAEVL